MRIPRKAWIVPFLSPALMLAGCSGEQPDNTPPPPQNAPPPTGEEPVRESFEAFDTKDPSATPAFDSNQWNSALGLGGGAGGKFGGRAGGLARRSAESYAAVPEGAFVTTAEVALSTFAADVDTASFANVRRYLNSGELPPADAVRVEEVVNAFRYGDPEPAGGDLFGVGMQLGPCPWNPGHELLRIGLRTRGIDTAKVPPCNLVFLIDVSGSMRAANKLPLVQRAMALLVDQLRPQDRVAIVTYASGVKVPLPGASGRDRDRILEVLQALRSGGSTAGAGGIQKAYEIALQHLVTGVNRVILCTDGDFNVGISDPAELETFITEKKDQGVFLTVLGVGGGNLKDDRLETLADKGNGVYAYLDDLAEARRVLVEQFGATMMTLAKDVKLQVEFDPHRVAAYRLVGYENRKLQAEDFRDDKKDGGEMGAGHAVTALYEIVPAAAAAPADEPLGILRVRYKPPEGDASRERAWPILPGGGEADLRLATAAAAFSMLLAHSEHLGSYGFGELLAWMAEHAPEQHRQQWQALEALARKAAGLSG